MGSDIERISRAAEFAAHRHSGQQRKGARKEPYINHLAEVADLVARASGGADADLVCAAWLHDMVEDERATRGEITQMFGDDVASLVMEATDDPSLPDAERKHRQEIDAPHKSPRAKLLKVADKVSNLRDIAKGPPIEWDREKRTSYVAWARRVVHALDCGNEFLLHQFGVAAEAAEEAIARG